MGGSQWQALWGISYAPLTEEGKRRQQVQRCIALAVTVAVAWLIF